MAWLKCHTEEGWFEGELIVGIEDSSGQSHILFVPEYPFVRTNNYLRVEILDSDDSRVLIQLPEETLEEIRTVTVFKEQLRELG